MDISPKTDWCSVGRVVLLTSKTPHMKSVPNPNGRASAKIMYIGYIGISYSFILCEVAPNLNRCQAPPVVSTRKRGKQPDSARTGWGGRRAEHMKVG